MDVVSLSPLRTGSLLWQSRPGVWVLTVVCKATYVLVPLESQLAEHQDEPHQADRYWNDDPAQSLRAPTDMAPFKPRADIFLVGHAYAPGGTPVASLTTRLIVGDVDKSVEVHGDRGWTQEGQLREGPRFTKMPLLYERAAGGPDTWNPVGVRPDARPDRYGVVPVPNLQPPGKLVASPRDHVETAGYGPIAATWPARAGKLYQHAAGWAQRSFRDEPLPEGIDPGHFNVAPPDQQVETLRSNERIILENLHPQHARLVTSLPGGVSYPRAIVERPGLSADMLALRCDTLAIDTDRGTCTLTWRGQLALSHPSQPGRVVISMVGAVPPRRSSNRQTADASAIEQARAALPFSGGGARPPPPPPPRAPESPSTRGPQATPNPGLPFGAPAPSPDPPAPVAAPPMARGPWAASEPSAAGSLSIGQLAAARSSEPAAPPAPPGAEGRSPPVPAPVPPADLRAARIAETSQAALAASDAAALAQRSASEPVAAAPVTAAPAGPGNGGSREYVELLWFHEEAPRRARAQASWLEALRGPAGDSEWITADEAYEPKQDVKDRRDVTRALTRVPRVDADGVAQAVAAAIDAEGVFTRPLVVVAGSLQLFFEELETLKATIAVISPMIGADKKLKEIADAANETVQSEWRCTSAVAEGMTARLREAFAQASRSLPAGYVESSVERILLEQRSYQKRTLLGEKRLRAAMVPGGAGAPIPTYLPESLEKELPMFQRFRAVVVAEVHSQQDQFESHPTALLVLALGRVQPVAARGR